MAIRAPHFLLMSETNSEEDQNQWRFVLASSDGDKKLVASDVEPATQGERLELLSVVRGLEALDQPSHVTLLTDSRYVSQGIAHGISEWRANNWCWERFGELTPVKNLDLWQRIDRALKFHRVDCRTWRFDSAHAAAAPAASIASSAADASAPARSANPSRARALSAERQAAARVAHSPDNRQSNPAPARRGAWSKCRRWLGQAADTMRVMQGKIALNS